jgi:flagellar biosynthetic protein FlhB
VARQAITAALPPVVLVMVVTGLFGAIAHVSQSGFILSGEKIKPDLSKLDLMKGLKRLFGIDGLMQFAKSAVKFLVTGLIAWMVLKPKAGEVINLVGMDPAAMIPEAMKLAEVAVLRGDPADGGGRRLRLVLAAPALHDPHAHDAPGSEGRVQAVGRRPAHQGQAPPDPDAALAPADDAGGAQGDRRGHEPDPLRRGAEVRAGRDRRAAVRGQGHGRLALKIRAVAEEHGVPVLEDAPLARALYAAVEIDEEIPTEHFEAVAKVIGFILNGKKPKASARPL